MAQVRKSWMKSKMNPNGENSTHSQFSEEMVRKTIINRTCKDLINSSSDKNLLNKNVKDAFIRSDEQLPELLAAQEIEREANQQLIDVAPSEDPETWPDAAPVNGGAQTA